MACVWRICCLIKVLCRTQDKERLHSIISRKTTLSCQPLYFKSWTRRSLTFTKMATTSENSSCSIIVSVIHRVPFSCVPILKPNSSITAVSEQNSVVHTDPTLPFAGVEGGIQQVVSSWSGCEPKIVGTHVSHPTWLAEEWRKKSLRELAKEPGRGLAFEVFALRDIRPGTSLLASCFFYIRLVAILTRHH